MPHDVSVLEDEKRSANRPAILPFVGWALQAAADLEEAADCSLIAPLMTASPWRRASVFAALSIWQDRAAAQNPVRAIPPAALVPQLLEGRMGDVVDMALGDVPGLARLIQRTAPDPLKYPGDYRKLRALLKGRDRPRNRAVLRVLRQFPTITTARIDTALILPPALLTPKIVDEIDDPRQAWEMAQSVKLVGRYCAPPDTALRDAVSDRRRRFVVPQKLVQLRSVLLEHGCNLTQLEDDEDFEFLRDGPQFAEAIRRFRDFTAIHICESALGLEAFAIWRGEPCLIHLFYGRDGVSSEDGAWYVYDISDPQGEDPSKALLDEILSKLRARGIRRLEQARPPESTTFLDRSGLGRGYMMTVPGIRK